jgi:hypothetical protein
LLIAAGFPEQQRVEGSEQQPRQVCLGGATAVRTFTLQMSHFSLLSHLYFGIKMGSAFPIFQAYSNI